MGSSLLVDEEQPQPVGIAAQRRAAQGDVNMDGDAVINEKAKAQLTGKSTPTGTRGTSKSRKGDSVKNNLSNSQNQPQGKK